MTDFPANPESLSLGAAPRFCAACGTPIASHGAPCARCEARARIAPHSPSEFASRNRAVHAAIALYFVLLGVCMFAAFGGLALPERPSPEDAVRAESMIGAVFSGIVLVFCLFRWRDIRPLLLNTGSPRWYLVAAGGGVATFILATLAMALLHTFVGVKSLDMTSSFRAAGSPIWFPFLLIAVQPAVFEELAFRGFIAGALERALGPMESFFLTAFMFVFLHLSPVSSVHLLTIALALGLLRRKSGSLYPCMVLHFTHNALCVAHELISGALP